MGTNYFLHINPCSCCGRAKESLHIGKISCPYRVHLEKHEEFYKNLEELKEFLKKGQLWDEYDEKDDGWFVKIFDDSRTVISWIEGDFS